MEQQLFEACKNGHLETVKKMASIKRLDWNAHNPHSLGRTALHSACLEGHVHIVRFLLTLNKVNVDETDHAGFYPLHYACFEGHLEIVRLLAALSAVKVNEKNKAGKTLLHYACLRGQIKVVQFLTTLQDVNVNEKDNTGKTPLHSACLQGHLDIVRFLSTLNEVNVNAKTNTGRTPIHFACIRGFLEVVRFLSTLSEVNLNDKDNTGYTPIHYACFMGRLEMVRFLLSFKQVHLHELDLAGNTPLHSACVSDRLDIVRFLIEIEGADYTIQNNQGSTPKDLAFERNNSVVIKYLENISKNSSFSLSCQKRRRLERYYEKQSISKSGQKHDEFNHITNNIFEKGNATSDEMQCLAQSIETTQDVAIICSIAKGFNAMGKLTTRECDKVLNSMLMRLFDEELIFIHQDYIYIMLLLDGLKEQHLLSEEKHALWKYKVQKINSENSLPRIDMLTLDVATNASGPIGPHEYDRLHDYFQYFQLACVNKVENEIIFGLLRTGVSILQLTPLMHDFSGLIGCAMDISNPVQFCRIVFEEESLSAFMETGREELVIKPDVKSILVQSNIEENAFITILEGLLRTTAQDEDTSGHNNSNNVEPTDDNQHLLKEKHGNDTNSIMEDTISEVSSTHYEDKFPAIEYAKTLNLVNLCKALKGKIDEDDFMGEMMDHQYITALHFSEGDVSTFKRTIKYIPSDYNVNQTAKLRIKREGSEDIEVQITAIQYAALCGYVEILEDYFLSEDQTDHIDFGLDNPVSCYVFASNRQKLLSMKQ